VQGEPGPQGIQGPPGQDGASGLTDWQVVEVSQTAAPNAITQIVAQCPPGKKALGGGFARSGGTLSPNPIYVMNSWPGNSPHDYWVVDIFNPAAGASTTVYAYAVCATP
jgi:hypothetical protein